MDDIKVELKNLTKMFRIKKNIITAFEDISLKIKDGEFWCFVGPSGCGKTTLLRVLAGLENPTDGTMYIKHMNISKPLNSMVFQEHAIFPWMDVKNNIAYGLKMRKLKPNLIDEIVDFYIEKMGLTPFKNAYPHQLSGGMKQRVSIARAFANDPEILLMDEPFANLDEQNRVLLQQELLKIWEESKKTVIFVTHSIDEAIFLSDKIMLMTRHPGKIKNIYDINIKRPRVIDNIRSEPQYVNIFQDIWSNLREEVSN
ncbi:ABC transporter ATP-binding protein [Thermoanaerobacterium thermosaccharolyticum]|uniref:ABC-type nitrate/sulfonate/bicarbonate transport system, ATPase component n=1 Tax=Thermoanaerobacterium thermosaccharolyticum M0795 TaxID=698948 RepID=L0IHV1_THETR|nr:ABC transporter ATP-binding protein [Thermoanaerobacterium thermosaccharolyticum]AGB18319.1 ABC-type nitrate/sulfonate/bicarbonate transport system, ATPase component [Thermoanaerobacterium thermosaccharolyticum M0795]